MACATLKRSLDWEAINQRPTKRRRCNPFGHHTTDNGSPLRSHRFSGKSNCSNATASLSSSYAAPDDNVPLYSANCRLGMEQQQQPPQHSPFAEASLSKISAETMAKNVRVEIKRLHKRKQLPLSSTAIERMQDSESSGSEMGAESPLRPESPPSIVRNPEKALFTFKQVQLICQRMLQDREDELRENYDAVLTTKLAEQYDAFVKFTYDQIQRRYEAAPSYLS